MVVARPYGVTADGHAVTEYTLENARGMQVKCLDWGGRVTSIRVPDREGHLVDVVLGFDALAEYEADTQSLGAFVGRYANRIERAVFTLDGVEHRLQVNNGPNHNHGPWGSRPMQADWAVGGDRLILRYHSPAGEDDMPGTVDAQVQYILEEDNTLTIRYHAVTDAATPINLTNHSYFNLDGGGDVLNQKLRIYASRYLEGNNQCCPTGAILPVADTPMDFTAGKLIGREIDTGFAQTTMVGGGYDHCYVIDRARGSSQSICAWATSDKTGISMKLYTTQPGIQLYTANFLQDCPSPGKGGKPLQKYGGFALETQHYPCSPSHPEFPSTVLRAGKVFRATTTLRFFTGKQCGKL